MKAKIWVLCTVLSDENAPAMPAVFAAEAWAKYDEVIRAEWDNLMDADDGPYPGDPDEAQERIRRAHGAEWSRCNLEGVRTGCLPGCDRQVIAQDQTYPLDLRGAATR